MLSENKILYNCLKPCHNALRDGTGRDGLNCVLSAQFLFFQNLLHGKKVKQVCYGRLERIVYGLFKCWENGIRRFYKIW